MIHNNLQIDIVQAEIKENRHPRNAVSFYFFHLGKEKKTRIPVKHGKQIYQITFTDVSRARVHTHTGATSYMKLKCVSIVCSNMQAYTHNYVH